MGSSGSKESKYYADFEAKLPELTGKTVVITGCTSGTGLIAAKCSVRKGCANLLMLNRQSDRSKAAEEAVKAEVKDGSSSAGGSSSTTTTNVETVNCDLQDFDSVKKAAATIKAKYDSVDVLCNNAGVMALEDVATKDGYDVQIQTNHLSHFLLTKELLPLLQKADSARIVHHSSMARRGGPLKPEYFGKNGGNLGGNGSSMLFNGARWERYHQSKLANMTFTACLADKLKGTNIVAAVAAPGLAQTSLQQTTNSAGGMGGSSMWIMLFAQSAEDGTMPLLAACFSPETMNGDFWEPKNGMAGIPVKKELDSQSRDDKQQKMLWEESEKACGKFEI